MEKHDASWPFQEPVDTSEVEDYLTVIKDPIDLSKIKQRLDEKYYKSKEMVRVGGRRGGGRDGERPPADQRPPSSSSSKRTSSG